MAIRSAGESHDFFRTLVNVWGTVAPPDPTRFASGVQAQVRLDIGTAGRPVTTLVASAAAIAALTTATSGAVGRTPEHLATKGYVDAAVAAAPAPSGTVGLAFVVGEEPAGTMDGANAVFATSRAYAAGTLFVYHNGLRLCRREFEETSATTFRVTGDVPVAGEVLVVDYIAR